MVEVKKLATLQDCIELAPRLRSEDLKEVLATRPNANVVDTLYDCIELSYKSYSVQMDGVGCIAIFGVRKTHLGGIPWLLCSDLLLDRSCRKFIVQSKDYFRELTEDFTYSFNHVAVTNIKAHRWLTWLGFTLIKTHTNTVNGVVFYPFTYTRK
jgi:hypothetical protein